MPDIKILTDIEIRQCPVWTDRTSLLSRSGSVVKRLASLLRAERSHDVVVSADLRLAQLFGLYRTLFGAKRNSHIVLELMLDEANDGLLWKTKNLVQRLCFASVDSIFVSSTSEKSTYARRLRIPESRFRFLPFHTSIIEPHAADAEGDYVLSAGRTGRDWETLARAVEGLSIRVVVISDEYHARQVQFPPNVELYCDIPKEQYLQLLRGCKLVVVPLKKLVKSTGQVAFLEAMGLGKPVIGTRTIGTTDYIDHDVTGFLVPPGDVEAMSAAIQRYIDDPHHFDALAAAALNRVIDRHTFEVYTRTILEEAERLASAKRPIGVKEKGSDT